MTTTIINNINLFDGNTMTDQHSLAIRDGIIVAASTGDKIIDGHGGTLMPGLIDSHMHLYNEDNLRESTKFGVTTLMDMGTRDAGVVHQLQGTPGIADIRSAYIPAFAPDSVMPEQMHYPASAHVTSPEDAARFVKDRADADYIKVILEDQGANHGVNFPKPILAAIVKAAHDQHKKVVAHVVSTASYLTALSLGVDVLTHIPFMMPMPIEVPTKMAAQHTVAVPTMISMKAIVDSVKAVNPQSPFDFKYVNDAVATMHRAGVTILAGTDSNTGDATTPFTTPYGISMHQELQLFVNAGLSTTEALTSATALPAQVWGLTDRGTIEVGKRADLLLLAGDPTANIANLDQIQQVWVRGEQFFK